MCNDVKKHKIDRVAIYKGLWMCRDFELQHLWQRSVFLTAFLLACYAGYGTLVVKCVTGECYLLFSTLNLIATGICLIGLILSALWIMMAKGSKAWYEHYEAAINAFVERYSEDENVFEGDASQLAGFKIDNVEEFEECDISSWLWSTKAGSFSVSKINISLGHLSALIWSGMLLFHIFVLRRGLVSVQELAASLESIATSSRVIVLVGCVLLLFWVYSRALLKSTYFGNK